MIARTSTTLDRLPQGHSGHIAEITGDANGRRRLQELGLIPGAPIRLVGSAPLRDPMEFDLGGYRLSLRRSQAAQVHLSTDSVAAHQRLAWREVVQPATPLNTQQQPQAGKELVVALVGNPNAGKSTLFNAITGLRQRVGNFPGVTVDRYEGRAPLPGNRQARIIDLPGTYSLVPTSPDEAVTMGVLAGHCADIRQVDVLCAVVDATNLTRNLMLVTQLLETGLPVVVALTMMDMARKRGLAVDHQALAKHLGVPVVPVVAHRGEGLVALAKALAGDAHQASEFPWQAASHLTEAVAAVTESLQTSGYQGPCLRAQARNLLLGDDHLLPPAMRQQSSMLQTLTKVRQTLADQGIDPVADDIASRYAWIRGLLPIVTPQAESGVDAHRRRGIDRVLLHPLWGLMVFGVVMWALFAVIFTVADPIMGLFEEGGTALAAWLGALLPSGAVQDMWNEGVAPGVGGVVVFLPQIALLLMLVALLEHSGYLARASYLLDRPLALVGLHGRSFVPMLTSHACAIPGIMAARGIEHPRDRLATMLVAPFMACGARLPVYLLLVGLLFSAYPTWVQGTILFSLYVMGIVAAVLISLLLKVTLLRGGGSSFVIELPDYRIPPWREVLRAVLSGSGQFLKKAGTLILAFSILLWAGLTYPKLDEAQTAQIIERHGLPSEALDSAAYADHLVHHDLAAAGIEHSAVGRFGRMIEPLIEPLGYDWKIGVGLVGAFAAREVFVSTMGVVYGVGEVEDETQPLAARMGEEVRPDGSPRYSLLLGISLLVWFVLAMQCISTVAVMWRETKSWRWPLMQLVGMNTMAYIVCLAIWQIGTRL